MDLLGKSPIEPIVGLELLWAKGIRISAQKQLIDHSLGLTHHLWPRSEVAAYT